jgi:hypothetical protein
LQIRPLNERLSKFHIRYLPQHVFSAFPRKLNKSLQIKLALSIASLQKRAGERFARYYSAGQKKNSKRADKRVWEQAKISYDR